MADDRINVQSGRFENQTRGKSAIMMLQSEEEERGNRSRAQRAKRNSQEEQQHEDDEYEQNRLPTWLSVILWMLRKSIVPIIMLVMLVIGLYVGYVILGKEPKDEVFEWSTWKHLYDLIFAES